MNGHCEFHIFEQAVDVCGLCFGDLCSSCALSLSGRRDTICKECALTISGVRGSGRIEFRGDRRTRKERKKAYAAAGPRDSYFRFFDEDLNELELIEEPQTADAGATAPASEDPAEKPSQDRTRTETDPTAEDVDGQDETSTGRDRRGKSESAGRRRIFGRRKTDKAEPIPEDDDFISIASILGSEEDATDESGTADADAVSQLADIRRQSPDLAPPRMRQADLPDHPQPGPPQPEPESSQPEPEPPQPEPGSSQPEPRQPDRQLAPSGKAENPFLKRDSEPEATVPQADFTTDPFAPPEQDAGTQSGPEPEPASVSVSVGDGPAPEEETSPDRADVDDRGLWIPPILRGIAEDAAEAAGELPRRRRS